MRQAPAATNTLTPSAQNLSRILIASYLMAIALGLVSGTTGSVIWAMFLPGDIANIVATASMFGLAFMVMIGVWLRPAALLLAIVMFWSSYITLISPDASSNVDSFWRDLALIGALFLTYAQSSRRVARMRSVLRRKHHVRKLKPNVQRTPRRITPMVEAPATNAAAAESTAMPEFRSQRGHVQAEPVVEDTSDQGENIFDNVYPLKASA
jgi:uncharacterized membrane protein YphA (DoxX/SURF4 family)